MILAALRTVRLPAALVVLSLALGAAAPAVACGLAMDAPPEAAEVPCPMHDAAPGPSETPPDDECCVVTSPAVQVVASSVTVPLAPVAAAVVLAAPTRTLAPAADATGSPPAPAGPLHLLHGCFLT